MLTAEQLVAAQKANLETLFDLTNKAFEGVEKLVELNLQVAKASMTEVQATATASLGVKDAQELPQQQMQELEPQQQVEQQQKELVEQQQLKEQEMD